MAGHWVPWEWNWSCYTHQWMHNHYTFHTCNWHQWCILTPETDVTSHGFMVYRTRSITVGVRFSWFLCLCWFMVYRTRNITFGVRLSWFLRLCWFMVYRTRNITVGVRLSCRADRTDRTNRISTDCTDRTNRKALCPDVIMTCTLRMSSDRTDRTNRNALCPHVIMRRTLRICSVYGPWVIVTVCAERTVR